jgi:nucleoside 2-deoxyribosyltransferase
MNLLYCPFCSWKNPPTLQKGNNKSLRVECPRCGLYFLSVEATADALWDDISTEDRILFSGYLRSRPKDEIYSVLTNTLMDNIPEIIAPYKTLTIIEKINMVLLFLGNKSKIIGQQISLDYKKEFTQFYFKKETEFKKINDYLSEKRLVKIETPHLTSELCKIQLTIEGFNRYEELRAKNRASKKAFIAMNFDPKYNPLYEAIKLACSECAFIGERVDKSEHNGKICNRIIREIKESRFVIADFTGQKAGVYYEAGYAQGLGIPVIWTCHKNEIDFDQVHFDTRQYNHIAWTNENDIKTCLCNRIKATIL